MLVQSAIWPFGYDRVYETGEFVGWKRLPDDGGDIPLQLMDGAGGLGPNAYEIMAFFAQSSTLALGLVNMGPQGPNNRWRSIDLSTLGYSTSMSGGRYIPNHSFEWRYDSQTTWAFWNEIMVRAGLSRTYDP